jgi:D-alanyl-D-alanine carboxypeptidase/D-alanyl-D-alanine-endopeptidase (penicillin-binding protein 4)
MKRTAIILFILGFFWPVQISEMNGRAAALDIPPRATVMPDRPVSEVLSKSLIQLQKVQRRRFNPENAGVLVETLDGSKVIAEYNSDLPFNPASVMKLGTSFFALDRLGPNFRFRTAIYGDEELDIRKKSLQGDLYLVSDGDPVFQTSDALAFGRALVRRGLRRVNGDLVVLGPFAIDAFPTRETSAQQLRRCLTRLGIRLTGKVVCAEVGTVDLNSKIHYLSHDSEKLKDILWLQNAYSINEFADRLGDLLGGAMALRQFLRESAALEPQEIFVARPSGLEHNRMTPRAGVRILRALNTWLVAHQMKMQDILPVAGIDDGTLFGRLRDQYCLGGILGKTGTNPSKDGGVSTLAGIAYTRDHGPVVYAIFNANGRVAAFRHWQDYFLRILMEESGGVGQYLSARTDLATLSSFWVPSSYLESLGEEPTVAKKSVTRSSYVKKAKYSKKVARHPGKSSTRRTGA